MRRLFAVLATAIVAIFVACETESPKNSQGFNITSGTQYEVEAQGGNIYVTYEGANEVTTTILSGDEAIKNIITPTKGVIVVTFNINNTGAVRTAVVEVRANEEKSTLVFLQAAGTNGGGDDNTEEIKFTALCLDGYYYGQKYGEGSDRYAFFLSDQGLNNGGQAYTNGTYYYVDCFAPVSNSASLPLGTYTFDMANSGDAWTINSENSQLILTGESVEETQSIKFTDAKMTISANKITLEATINGKLHKVSFFGDLELTDATEENGGDNGGNNNPTGGQEKDAQTTLTEDINVTFGDGHRVKWVYEGDYWQTGYSNYTIMMMNKANGYVYGITLQLDIITDNTSTNGDIYGTYKCSYTPGKSVLMAGFTNDYAMAVGSWLFDYNMGGGSYNGYAMIIDGELTISDAGNGQSTIVLNGLDCLGNKITCNWTGVIEED